MQPNQASWMDVPAPAFSTKNYFNYTYYVERCTVTVEKSFCLGNNLVFFD
jgi:hypothetical protein